MVYNDRELLARTLQAEAGNQGFRGMVAAGSVIANRVGAGGYGGSLRDVILKPGQFSAWNKRKKADGSFIYAGGEQGQDMGNMRPSQDAYKAADAILSGNYEDPTGGATHYFNPDISQPKWGQSGQWKRIGDHVFGSADAGRSNKKGTSKMDQQQPTAQQMQQQQRGGLMGFLGNPRTREALLSMDRSGLFEGMRQRATADVAKMESREQQNRTAQWLASQPNGQKYAQAVMQGAMTGSEAYSQYMADTQRKGVKVGDKLVDPVTGEVIYETAEGQTITLDKDQNAIINSLNDDLRSIYKPYQEIMNGYNQIANAIANPQSGIGDLVMTVAFAKILDPGSVVRSEESAAVAAAGGGIGAAIKAFENFISGTGLLPEPVRTEIQSTAKATAQKWYDMSKKAYDRSVKQAELSGIPMDIIKQVIAEPQVLQFPALPAPPGEDPKMPHGKIPQSAIDAGLTQDQWNKTTAEDRAAFGS